MYALTSNETLFVSGCGTEDDKQGGYGKPGDFGPDDWIKDLFDTVCSGLGDVSGAAVGRAVGAVNPALGAGLGEAVREGVTQCCQNGSMDSCGGRSSPPPEPVTGGGGGASGGW